MEMYQERISFLELLANRQVGRSNREAQCEPPRHLWGCLAKHARGSLLGRSGR